MEKKISYHGLFAVSDYDDPKEFKTIHHTIYNGKIIIKIFYFICNV